MWLNAGAASGKKKRHCHDHYDLDLAYITGDKSASVFPILLAWPGLLTDYIFADRLIGMCWPAQGLEGELLSCMCGGCCSWARCHACARDR